MPCQVITIFEAVAIIFPLYKCAHSLGLKKAQNIHHHVMLAARNRENGACNLQGVRSSLD